MLTETEKKIILDCAQKYNVSSLVIFGSSVSADKEYNDIDIGIKGLDSRLFFKFYAELFKRLEKPVDLIDLSRKTLFTDLIEDEGIKIYG